MASHDVSHELREPHSGKWTKGGQALSRMAHEAVAAKVKGIEPGGGKNIKGHWVDRPASEGGKYRVKLKTGDKGKRDTRVYASAEEAAKAVHSDSHSASAPAAPGARQAEIKAQNQAARERASAARASSSVRSIRAGELKPGMTVSTDHWQAPKGPHEITKLEKSGAGSRSGGVRSSHGIYNTASTHIHHEGGKYEVSNNTKFRVHKEAPSGAPAGDERPYANTPESALRDMVNRGGNQAATKELMDRMLANEKARVEAENKKRFPQGSTQVYDKPMGGGSGINLAGGAAPPPSASPALAKMTENDLQRMVDRRGYNWKGAERELARRREAQANVGRPAPGSMAHKIAQTEASFHEQGISYSPQDLVATRLDSVVADLKAGDRHITIKVPSGSEVTIPRDVAQELVSRVQGSKAKDWRQQKLREIGHVRSGRLWKLLPGTG